MWRLKVALEAQPAKDVEMTADVVIVGAAAPACRQLFLPPARRIRHSD